MTLRFASSLLLLLAGCSAPAPYMQTVEGSIQGDALPLTGIPVRFVLSPPDEAQSCSPARAETVTDSRGHFSLTAQYNPTQSERYAVVLKQHIVCAQVEGQWQAIWQLKTGPMLHASLRCTVSRARVASCTL